MARFRSLPIAIILILLSCGYPLSAEPPKLPSTPRKPVTDTYHGVTAADDFRWLEKVNDPEVKKWIDAQNAVSRATLDASPNLGPLKTKLKDLLAASSISYSDIKIQGGKIFAIKFEPPKEQPYLVTLESLARPESARVVIDPNQIDAKGKTTIDFYIPSRDGKLVAVCLSANGSEEGSVSVFEVATGKKVDETIPRVNYPTAGGDLCWDAGGTGFYYTRYPRENERPKEDMNFFQQLYFHKLGTPFEKDAYVLGKDLPRIAEIFLDSSTDGRYILASVQKGDGGEYEHFLKGPEGDSVQITHFEDQISSAAFGGGDDKNLYLLSRKGAPRGKIVRLALEKPNLAEAQVVLRPGPAIEGMHYAASRMVSSYIATPGGLFVLDVDGGPSQVRFVSKDGLTEEKVPLPAVCSVGGVTPLEGEEILLHVSTFTEPPAWYTFRRGDAQLKKTALFSTSPIDCSDVEVIREYASSRDGTKVPLTILLKKGTKRDGTNPTLLTGYGGFGISQKPHFLGVQHLWIENGGILAIANLRGGGEYGEEWHKAGNLTHKQNVFDDFIACAKFMIGEKYTNAEKLAIEGGSNGGLLMGAALTQQPQLFRAVVTHVGLYDMLRFEQHPNGVFNVTEYGSVKDAEQFKALYAYSPYHHVKEGTAYPAVFLLAGLNDGRVDPAQTLKMTARLQAATSSKRPILAEIASGSGHGIGDNLSSALDRAADVYAFLFDQLGMKIKEK